MATVVMILGKSGDGKTSGLIVAPNGDLPLTDNQLDMKKYQGMDPATTVIINCDEKVMAFPAKEIGWETGKNLFNSTHADPFVADRVEKFLDAINKGTQIKAVVIDTINGSLNANEMLAIRKMTHDQWYDNAKDWFRVLSKCNSMREDLVIYIMGHVVLNELGEKVLVTSGKKLEKIHLESKATIVLHTNVEGGFDGDNTFSFETKKNKSSSKSPIGMFSSFLIPNSLKLVDDTIRKYYNIK
jgi:hypothetical protein